MVSGRHTREKAILSHPKTMKPEDWLRFIEMPGFTRGWKKLGLEDEDVNAIQMCIMVSPHGPPIVSGTGGLRKIRFAPGRWKSGKRGAARVCYAYFEEFSVVILVTIYPKTRKDDLTQEEKREIKRLLEGIGRILKTQGHGKENRDG